MSGFLLLRGPALQCMFHGLLSMQGVEATLFAALMSILNGGAFAGSFLGSLLTRALGVDGQDFTNLAPLVYTLYYFPLLLPY